MKDFHVRVYPPDRHNYTPKLETEVRQQTVQLEILVPSLEIKKRQLVVI